jgi:hypothetical protein
MQVIFPIAPWVSVLSAPTCRSIFIFHLALTEPLSPHPPCPVFQDCDGLEDYAHNLRCEPSGLAWLGLPAPVGQAATPTGALQVGLTSMHLTSGAMRHLVCGLRMGVLG